MRVNGTLYYVLKDHLGSTSVLTDNSGNVVGDQRYYPFGFTRLASGSMYTDKLFTGQREMAGLGIYHFGARFYSPYTNRFLSADTVVPNPSDPQAFNRYSYVLGNPLRYVDPSGNIPIDCWNNPNYCSNTTTLYTYSPPVKPQSGGGGRDLPGVPGIEDVPNPEGATPEVQQSTADSYQEVREILWEQCGSTCVDPSTGMIADEYLVALIILGEFGDYRGSLDNDVYLEGLEAVSNQYYSAADLGYTVVGGMLCNGACTVNTQLSWLYDIEAVRSENFVTLVSEGQYNPYLNDANLAVAPGGYSNGIDSSWNWGNITRDEINNFCITALASPSLYPDTDYFIVYSCKK